jgi:DNA-binding NarL/FixJ family response regulator
LSVEDHPIFREGLSKIIASQSDMSLVAQATTAVAGGRRIPAPSSRHHAHGCAQHFAGCE